jgi:hypothetical protein
MVKEREAAARVVLELASHRDKGDFLSNGGLVASRVGRRHAREGADEVVDVSDVWEVGGRAAPDRDRDAETEMQRQRCRGREKGSPVSSEWIGSVNNIINLNANGRGARSTARTAGRGKARCSRSRGRRALTGVGTRPSLCSGPVATLTAKVWSLVSALIRTALLSGSLPAFTRPMSFGAVRMAPPGAAFNSGKRTMLVAPHCSQLPAHGSTLMQTRRHVGSPGASFIPEQRATCVKARAHLPR